MKVLRSRGLWMVLGVLLAGTLAGRWARALGPPGALLETWGWWAPVLSTSLHALASMSPLPSELIAVANGSVYGFGVGALLSWLAGLGAAACLYAVWRRGAQDFGLEARLRRLPGWVARFPVNSITFLVLVRLVPYAGGHLASALAGSCRVPVWRHMMAAAIGLAPGAVLFAALGAGLRLV